MKSILYLTNIPAPYTVDFFNLLGKRYDLTVLFERCTASTRKKQWFNLESISFKHVFLKGILNVGEDNALCPQIFRYVNDKKYDYVIIGAYSSPTALLLIPYMVLKKKNYIIHADGGIINNSDSELKRRIKRFVFANALACFSSGKETSNYYKHYGVDKKKILEYPFTSISDDDICVSPAGELEKRELRKNLSLSEDKIVISIGQMIPRKGFDVLIKAAKQTDLSIGYYCIGGTPYNELCHLKETLNLSNVHFVEFQNKREIYSYLRAADLFVCCTRYDIWGLVINEAMAAGVPVISSNKCNAALELVKDNYNGFIFENENDIELASLINRVISNGQELYTMGQRCLETMHRYTLENMVKQYTENLEIVKRFSDSN